MHDYLPHPPHVPQNAFLLCVVAAGVFYTEAGLMAINYKIIRSYMGNVFVCVPDAKIAKFFEPDAKNKAEEYVRFLESKNTYAGLERRMKNRRLPANLREQAV